LEELPSGIILVWLFEISLLLNGVKRAAYAVFPFANLSLISCLIVLSELTIDPKYL
jgi:hypothetical protein